MESSLGKGLDLVVVGEVVVGDGDGGGGVDGVDESVVAPGHGDVPVVPRRVPDNPPATGLNIVDVDPVDDHILHKLQRNAGAVGDVNVSPPPVDGLADHHVPLEDHPQWLLLYHRVPQSPRFGNLPFLPPTVRRPKPSAQVASRFRWCAQFFRHRQHRSMGLVAMHGPPLCFPSSSRRVPLTSSSALSESPRRYCLEHAAAMAAARAFSSRCCQVSSNSAMCARQSAMAARSRAKKKEEDELALILAAPPQGPARGTGSPPRGGQGEEEEEGNCLPAQRGGEHRER
ncbi:unnamed protein product [Spirodela intermedia]|uniref:Uncharacterized protein n=1 Tax=Spirodela intermedia TaxID=51605 RepID=A0A7I8KZS8_SPIIN|nr:unnamed protein product [Spirodela intermedia]